MAIIFPVHHVMAKIFKKYINNGHEKKNNKK